jgi:hypothetical protein
MAPSETSPRSIAPAEPALGAEPGRGDRPEDAAA